MHETMQKRMPETMPETRVYHPLLELSLVRLREFLRQPEAVFWTFGFPVLLTLALGIAFRNTGPERVVVTVEHRGKNAAGVFAALQASPDLKVSLLPPEEAARQLRIGKSTLLVVVGNGVGDGASGDGAYSYRYDPTRPESRVARLMVDDVLQRHKGRVDPAAAHDERVTEPGSRYVDYLLPGLLGLNMMGSGMWGLGFAVVDMRSKRLLKRLAATPMRRSDFLLSFMVSRLVFLFLELALVFGFARVAFGVQLRGSLLDLAVVSLIGAFCFTAIGLLVAARPTTIEGISGWMNLVMMPMWLLSGTFFSYSRFPDFAQPLIRALPLTALNDALRSVITEGAGLAANHLELAILAAWSVACFVVAVRLFRWQ
jgi:ABC-2 type transport system permease protein